MSRIFEAQENILWTALNELMVRRNKDNQEKDG